MNEGWICPRYGRVNAPFTPHCDCKLSVQSNFTESSCNHQWVLEGIDTGGSHYRCILCGERKHECYDPNYNGVTR